MEIVKTHTALLLSGYLCFVRFLPNREHSMPSIGADIKIKNVSLNSCVSGSLPTEAEIEEHFYVNEDRMSDGDKERLLKQEGAKWVLTQVGNKA